MCTSLGIVLLFPSILQFRLFSIAIKILSFRTSHSNTRITLMFDLMLWSLFCICFFFGFCGKKCQKYGAESFNVILLLLLVFFVVEFVQCTHFLRHNNINNRGSIVGYQTVAGSVCTWKIEQQQEQKQWDREGENEIGFLMSTQIVFRFIWFCFVLSLVFMLLYCLKFDSIELTIKFYSCISRVRINLNKLKRGASIIAFFTHIWRSLFGESHHGIITASDWRGRPLFMSFSLSLSRSSILSAQLFWFVMFFDSHRNSRALTVNGRGGCSIRRSTFKLAIICVNFQSHFTRRFWCRLGQRRWCPAICITQMRFLWACTVDFL